MHEEFETKTEEKGLQEDNEDEGRCRLKKPNNVVFLSPLTGSNSTKVNKPRKVVFLSPITLSTKIDPRGVTQKTQQSNQQGQQRSQWGQQ